jgi:probable phosphoglycerate mutase
LTTHEIRARRPGWELFRDGCPGGEESADVAARADRVIARLRTAGGDALVFSSGHFLRVLSTRWCGADVAWGRVLNLGTAGVCTLGYDHSPEEPVIRLWNDRAHVGE